MKPMISLAIAGVFASQVAFAETSLLGFDDADVRSSNTTSEYVFKSTYRENLVPVQLLGAVLRPGLYFVPPKTDLVKLMTLAGGLQPSAENEITVRKADGSWDRVRLGSVKKEGATYNVDVKKVLKEPDYTSLTLSSQDVVYVPAHEPWISSDTSRTISVIALVASALASSLLAAHYLRKD